MAVALPAKLLICQLGTQAERYNLTGQAVCQATGSKLDSQRVQVFFKAAVTSLFVRQLNIVKNTNILKGDCEHCWNERLGQSLTTTQPQMGESIAFYLQNKV